MQKVIDAAYAAFHAGLDTALLVSAILILVAAIVTATSVRRGARGGYGPIP